MVILHPRLLEFLHFEIHSPGQKSHCTRGGHCNALFQVDSQILLVRASSELIVERRPQRQKALFMEGTEPRFEGKIRLPPQLQCSSQKRKLSPDYPTASPGLFGLRALDEGRHWNGSATGFRNRNRIPFPGRCHHIIVVMRLAATAMTRQTRRRTALGLGLPNDNGISPRA
ncbi:hypothetical protein J6590_045614 [Homalodisca vitripennis]|nr:hypothetical protein J6590_045614 [Homalodisca vitripennis]